MKVVVRSIVLALLTLLAASTATASQPMPYCECITMEYQPAGPDFPTSFQSEQLAGTWQDLSAVVEYFCIDIGDLPYSVPFHGWFCTDPSQRIRSDAEVGAMKHAIKVTMSPWRCCEGEVTPDDPLFWGGVIMEWDPIIGAYHAEFGSKVYTAEFDGARILRVNAGTRGVNTGAIAIYAEFRIDLLTPGMTHQPRRYEVK